MPVEKFEHEAKPLAAEHQNNLIADAYDWASNNPGKTAAIAAAGVFLISKGRIRGQLIEGAEKAAQGEEELLLMQRAAADEYSLGRYWREESSPGTTRSRQFPLEINEEFFANEGSPQLNGTMEKQAKETMTDALGRRDLIFDGKAPNAKAEESIKNWLQSHGYKIRYTDDLSARLGQP